MATANKKNISTYISETRATHMGHMQRIRQKLRLTKQQIPLYLHNVETEGMEIVQQAKFDATICPTLFRSQL